ncbi:SDR family oxidoreductase [Bordetella trematum]|uniref:SDR family oxidoreductase n=1 Tax=Bordetella trematum TaxID=123899 RepID=UPI000D9ED3FC|nr:SDR family oxidoreductase [Bordetella trematum]SPU48720.1 3-ketoacyl-(acyl-carrier-protein) reductase [Bordetella trematum]VDH04938.1 3-oxoacyl-[acyl-carrier-protein] reductase FabG [Bordetella trematum]
MRLKGKTAIITGAGSGFGEGIAITFAREGANVVVADINEVGGQRVADAIRDAGGQAVFARADVSRNDDVAGLLQTALSAFGGLTTVVNNAGTTHRNRPMLEVDEDEFDRIYAVNVKSIYLTAKHMVPHFRAHGGGAFINIASTAAIRPRPGLTWYNGTKGAVVTTSKSMAAELGPDNIRVNCVNPVIGATGLLADFMGMPDTPENRKRFLGTIPLGRFSTPQDIANACLYLASDEAGFITGTCLEVDGGRCV